MLSFLDRWDQAALERALADGDVDARQVRRDAAVARGLLREGGLGGAGDVPLVVAAVEG